MCPGADKHCSVMRLKVSGWSYIECWWCLFLERDPGLKGRICLTFYLKFISLYPSCFVRIFLHWLSHTLVMKGPPHVRYKTWKYDRDNRVVGWGCMSSERQHLSPEEVVEGFAGWVGVHWMEMGREIIPVRRTTWVEASIVALKVKTTTTTKTVGPGCET